VDFLSESPGLLSIIEPTHQNPAGGSMVIRFSCHTPAPAVTHPRAWPGYAKGRSRNASVLVVEDDQGMRETTTAILREEGYVVVQAADGVKALELLRGRDIDVLLLDIRLPRMDGAAVMEALDDPPPVVVISAFDSSEEAEIREQYGWMLFECLRKPVSPRRLIEVTAAAAGSSGAGAHG
jgi:CheY-like chemotaxis protein